MKDDVILNKAQTIERCIQRIQEEYSGFEKNLPTDYTKQDAIILNLQRACEAAIDMAARIIRLEHLGIPQSSRDMFVLLEKANKIPAELSNRLQAMVGFRNIAIHDYTQINLDIVKNIIEKRLDDFLEFVQLAIKGEGL
jgi:uncharacterized protein YutE (UPF0331/DUF86 family)